MSPEDWIAYRKLVSGSDDEDEFSDEALARIEAEHILRHRPPGQAWFEFQSRVPRRRWQLLLVEPVAAMKRRMALAEGAIPGIDEPLADALASALHSSDIREQLPQAPSARLRNQASRAKLDMKLTTARPVEDRTSADAEGDRGSREGGRVFR